MNDLFRKIAPLMNRSLLLVHPPQYGLMEGFSSGLISLANYVAARAPDVDVRLVDLGPCNADEMLRRLRAVLDEVDGHTVVGVSTTTASYQSALRVARVAKCLRPDCFVVFGGHHASPQADVVLVHHPNDVDAVIVGEGEVALLSLMRCFPAIESVPNLVYRTRLGINRTAVAPLLDQGALDSIGPIFLDGFLRSAPGKFDHLTYVSARGCPLRCAFCAVANEKIRAKSTSRVIEDLKALSVHHGCMRIAIEDNFFAHSLARTLELCAALERLRDTLPIKWDCQTRVESLARAGVVDAMANAGCEAVYIGVEALDHELLLHLGKTTAPERYLRTLEDVVVPRLLASPMNCYLNLQFGVAGETDMQRQRRQERLAQLGRAAVEAGREITVFPQLAVMYPGTAHFASALKERRFGLNTREAFEDFTEWESRRQPVLDWMGETFAHGTGGIPEGILDEYELRHGRFVVDGEAVLRILEDLRLTEQTPGIQLFRYGRYLAGADRRAATC